MTDDEREIAAQRLEGRPEWGGNMSFRARVAAQLRADGERIAALEAGIRTLFEAERREKGEESVAAMVALYALLKTPPVSGKEGE